MANKDISFCMNRKCTKTDCRRYYANAPFNTILSWINPTPDKDGNCEEYWGGKKKMSNFKKEEIELGMKCCNDFFCGECPYKKYEHMEYKIRCIHKLIQDINKLYFGENNGKSKTKTTTSTT